MEEVCCILSGEVTITPERGDPTKIIAGDLVTFPMGMKCVWKISEPVKKHYEFR